MAEGEATSGGGGGGGGESVKLFVGQVPKHMSEEELLGLFQGVALVDEVNIIKDKVTKASRGCCFVICPTREEADKAVSACHNKRTLPGASSPLQVKYADGELERLEHKLFVGMLPKDVTEAELYALFSKCGTIKDLQILRGSQQTSKGCAFLKFETKDQAIAALESLNGKHRMEGSTVPLVVKWADTEKERQARRAQKAQSVVSSTSPTSVQQPSLFGALPMGYLPPYNGYSYQAAGPYGVMQYPLSTMQSQSGFHNVSQPGSQGNSLRGLGPALPHGVSPRSFSAMQSGGYVGSAYHALPSLQYPITFSGNAMNRRPLNNLHSCSQPFTTNNSFASSLSNSTSIGGQIEGPPGANLFIYHIPQEFGDQDLSNAFQEYGRVLSAKVYVDKATGISKCFGFVSYDSPSAAQKAITMMNGCQLGGKKLKVQLKRENKQSKPY